MSTNFVAQHCVLLHLVETMNGLCDSGDKGGKVCRTRQANIQKRLLIRVKDALNTVNTGRRRVSVQSKAVARDTATKLSRHKTAKTISSKLLA